jgi:F-type H+-transporting ATPase subunit delta
MNESSKQPTVFDSEQQQLGKIYAKALLAFGAQSGSVDSLVEGLDAIVDVIREVPGLQAALESPRIAFEDKAKLLDKAFSGRVDKSLTNFLKVIGRKGRFDCLGAISSSARAMQDEMSGRVQAMMTSAAEIDPDVQDKIAQRLSSVLGKTVSLKASIDPAIIGGMVVRIGDTVYDGSVTNQLAQIRGRAFKHVADAIREKIERFATTE